MGIHSKVWGQYLWRTLHTITYTFDPKMPTTLREKYVKFFHVLKDFIPCPICRAHYTKRCELNPPEKNMKSTDALVSWLNNLHNEVNAGLGKPNIPKKYADSYYVKNGRLTYDFRDFVVLFRIMTMIKKLNFPAIIKFIQLFYEIYPEEYLPKNAPKSLELANIIQNNVKLNEWIVHFDMEHAKNKNTATYLTEKDVSYKINDEINSETVSQITARNQSANLPKRTNRVVRNEVDEFLRKYKII
jgi:hypothetical protein